MPLMFIQNLLRVNQLLPQMNSKDQLEEDIDALSAHSIDPDPEIWDTEGETPEEKTAWVTKYERAGRRIMAQRHRMGIASILRARLYCCF